MQVNRASIVFALVALFATANAHAQSGDEEARHHFRLGEAHYESGHFLEAAREFEQAYELSGRPALLHNVYVAYRDAGDTHNAARALRLYLETADNIDNETLLRQRLAVLERTIETGDSETEPSGDAPVQQTSSTPSGGPSPVGFAVGGIGLAMVIGGAITGSLAMVSFSELDSMCPNRECPADYDFESTASTGEALAIATDVLIPVGAAALATGVILLFVLQEGGSESSANVGGACMHDGCMAFVRSRF